MVLTEVQAKAVIEGHRQVQGDHLHPRDVGGGFRGDAGGALASLRQYPHA